MIWHTLCTTAHAPAAICRVCNASKQQLKHRTAAHLLHLLGLFVGWLKVNCRLGVNGDLCLIAVCLAAVYVMRCTGASMQGQQATGGQTGRVNVAQYHEILQMLLHSLHLAVARCKLVASHLARRVASSC